MKDSREELFEEWKNIHVLGVVLMEGGRRI
jgi:hypothetical protein